MATKPNPPQNTPESKQPPEVGFLKQIDAYPHYEMKIDGQYAHPTAPETLRKRQDLKNLIGKNTHPLMYEQEPLKRVIELHTKKYDILLVEHQDDSDTCKRLEKIKNAHLQNYIALESKIKNALHQVGESDTTVQEGKNTLYAGPSAISRLFDLEDKNSLAHEFSQEVMKIAANEEAELKDNLCEAGPMLSEAEFQKHNDKYKNELAAAFNAHANEWKQQSSTQADNLNTLAYIYQLQNRKTLHEQNLTPSKKTRMHVTGGADFDVLNRMHEIYVAEGVLAQQQETSQGFTLHIKITRNLPTSFNPLDMFRRESDRFTNTWDRETVKALEGGIALQKARNMATLTIRANDTGILDTAFILARQKGYEPKDIFLKTADGNEYKPSDDLLNKANAYIQRQKSQYGDPTAVDNHVSDVIKSNVQQTWKKTIKPDTPAEPTPKPPTMS